MSAVATEQLVGSQVDPNEAPLGYYATEKMYTLGLGNICRQCDWRPVCQSPTTDHLAFGHRCMGYAVESRDGRIHQRRDQCSVVFKIRLGDSQ